VDLFFFFFEFQIWKDAVFGFATQELAKEPEFQKKNGRGAHLSYPAISWLGL